MRKRDYPTAAETPHTFQQIDEHVTREGVQRARSQVKVSPGLNRPGLDPAPVPEPALHLLGGIWIDQLPDLRLPAGHRPDPGALRAASQPPALPRLWRGRLVAAALALLLGAARSAC
jgi:hypothetical protein